MQEYKIAGQFNHSENMSEFIGNGGGSAPKRARNSPTTTSVSIEFGAGSGDAGGGKQSTDGGAESSIVADDDEPTACNTANASAGFIAEEGDTIPLDEASETSVEEGVEKPDEYQQEY